MDARSELDKSLERMGWTCVHVATGVVFYVITAMIFVSRGYDESTSVWFAFGALVIVLVTEEWLLPAIGPVAVRLLPNVFASESVQSTAEESRAELPSESMTRGANGRRPR